METYRGVAFPWLCDHQGHLTTSQYALMFDIGCYHMLHAVGAYEGETSGGWADVRQEFQYRSEVPVGGLVVIDSTITDVGRTSVTHRHVMRNADQTIEHAEMRAVTVRLDAKTRRPFPHPSGFLIGAQAMRDRDTCK